MWTWLACLVGRHEWMRGLAPTRWYLQCLHCQKQTPGFVIEERKVA